MEQRLGPDRRREPRGGRREIDRRGSTPLVMVLDSDISRRRTTEAILGVSNFAVAPVATVEGALAICRASAPSVILCNESSAQQVREGLRPLVIPVILLDIRPAAPDELIRRIRVAVRGPSEAAVSE